MLANPRQILQDQWPFGFPRCLRGKESTYQTGDLAKAIVSRENPMNSMKRQNDRILKEKLPRSIGAQYATREEWRNNSRNNEETEPKRKQHPVVDVTGDGSRV